MRGAGFEIRIKVAAKDKAKKKKQRNLPARF